jgi:hypothetical protein
LLLQGTRHSGSEHPHCYSDNAMTTPSAFETDAFLAAAATASGSDVHYREHRFNDSKREAKAYPYKLARLRTRVREMGYEGSRLSEEDENRCRCVQDSRSQPQSSDWSNYLRWPDPKIIS